MTAPHALMWSGGKDCALALERARAAGLEVTTLLSFCDSATRRVRFHATRVQMLEAQARMLEMNLVSVATPWKEMDQRLRLELRRLREAGFAGVVLGNIHLADVRAWYEERVLAAGLEHVEPIWGDAPSELVEEFVAGGGRAVITCVDGARLGPEWLGRVVDGVFPAQIAATGVDPCGENGEYHTFAFDGPSYRHPVAWRAGAVLSEGSFLQLDLEPGAREG